MIRGHGKLSEQDISPISGCCGERKKLKTGNLDKNSIMLTTHIPKSGFFAGFLSLWQAFCFLRGNPSLLKYIVWPFVINVLVFAGTVYWGFDFFNQLVGQYLPTQDVWYWQLLGIIIKVLLGLVSAVVVFFTFTVLGNLIASPFNDVLSERTEQLLSNDRSAEKFSWSRMAVDLWRVITDELRKVSIFVILMILLLLFNLLPGIGSLIYALCSCALTVFFLVVEYTGYFFSRKHLGFRDQRRFIASDRRRALGFGLAVLCMLMLPFVQFFTIPLAVVAATLWCYDSQAV